MNTLVKTSPRTPAKKNGYWPFGDEFFRPFAEMVNSPMRTDVKETETAYVFSAELPGFDPSEIDLTVQDGIMTISAEHKEGKEDAPSFISRSIRRSFTLDGIDESSIEAQYKNGILQVTLPKEKEEELPPARKIEVK